RFDERLRELRQVDREERLGEALGERLALRIERDEAAAPDRRRARPLAGAGLTDEERREILHPPPQRTGVEPRIVGEDVVPQALAKPPHRRGAAGEGVLDESVRAAELPEERDVARRLVVAEAAGAELGHELAAERDAPRLR